MRHHSFTCATILLAIGGIFASAFGQDYNYVPGWANTTNHEYKGENDGEWEAKTELFAQLRERNPAAECTLRNLSDADGNVIVNRFRSNERKTDTATALRMAQEMVAEHHQRLQAEGTC
ncbi:hypothetical protein [Croceibacterium ferulae]|uniref:hypothetical protein n=1 Tax=Croceibacterium ferulae TaxID=1854641 RepID=UPI000EABFB85|nr:hypothetical protein [Croceibacterium ferulae]